MQIIFSVVYQPDFFISDDISFGLSAKYLYEGIFVDESTGWGFDFGLNYSTSIKGLSASAVVKNLGSMNKLKSRKNKTSHRN